MYLTSTLCRSGQLWSCPLVSAVNAVRQSVRSDCICYFRPHYVTSRSISTPSLLTMRPALLLRPHYTSLSFVASRFPLSFYTLTSEYKDKQKKNNPVQEWNTKHVYNTKTVTFGFLQIAPTINFPSIILKNQVRWFK